MGARLYDPEGAVAAGYLDEVVADFDLVTAAINEAKALGELRSGAYGRTKSVARRDTIEHILDTLEEDMADVTGPDGT